MPDGRSPFVVPFDDHSGDPLAGEVGRLDEHVPKKPTKGFEKRSAGKPWLEITLIAIVLLTGYLFGILAIAKL